MATIKKIEGKKGISYKITVSAGRNITGKQIRHYKTYVPEPNMTQRQIEKELNRISVEFEKTVEQGISVDGNIRFVDYAERWLQLNEPRFAPITYTRSKTLLVRINQAIGHLRMRQISPLQLKEFYKNLTEITSETTGKPLSPSTIKHYHRCISAILAVATKEQVIPRNVASREFMDAPKVTKKEPAHLDDEQSQRFVSLLLAEEDIRKKAAFLLFIYSGCRIGELTGLEWPDCDFEKCTISIKRSSQFCTGRGVITKATKNEKSIRTIKLSDNFFRILHEYKTWYAEQQFIIGSKWVNSNRLFVQADGKPITPTTINKWLNSFIKKHDLPKITPHGLRHTNISLLISHGVDIRTVANKAGHSRTSTTLDIYSHVIQSADEKASQVLDNILLGAV